MRPYPLSIRHARRLQTGPRVLPLLLSFLVLLLPQASSAKEKRGVVTVHARINAPAAAKDVKLWIPYPMSNENQEIADVSIRGNYTTMGVHRTGKDGGAVLYAQWDGAAEERTLTFSFRVSRKEVVTRNVSAEELPVSREEFRDYLAPSAYGPTDGAVKALAAGITDGKGTVHAKAEAIYQWVVENMHRDPDVKGCGLGDVEVLLGTLAGKCADISSVFVALARSAGVPAREIFGIRLPSSEEGDITRWQHCWAEFYLPGTGWIVVDPADVRKAILEKKLTLEEAGPLREYYFGAVDERRVEFGTGRDVRLVPLQAGAPLNYFMYPYAEADGQVLNEDLFGFNLGYTISFRER